MAYKDIDEQKNAPELPIGRFLKLKSLGGNRVILGVRPSMKTNWVAFAIFLDGVKKFEACDASVIPTLDLLERMQFVHDNIEYCFAEGRMMDSAIFFVLDNAADRIALDEYSTRKELWELAERLATRYGFAQQSLADSSWIKLETNGECLIWIDQANIINESNRRLFGSRD